MSEDQNRILGRQAAIRLLEQEEISFVSGATYSIPTTTTMGESMSGCVRNGQYLECSPDDCTA